MSLIHLVVILAVVAIVNAVKSLSATNKILEARIQQLEAKP
jgi:Tfp pilus assembly protein PilE